MSQDQSTDYPSAQRGRPRAESALTRDFIDDENKRSDSAPLSTADLDKYWQMTDAERTASQEVNARRFHLSSSSSLNSVSLSLSHIPHNEPRRWGAQEQSQSWPGGSTLRTISGSARLLFPQQISRLTGTRQMLSEHPAKKSMQDGGGPKQSQI